MAEPSILGRATLAKRTVAEPSILGRATLAKRTMAEPSILGRATLAKRTMAEPSILGRATLAKRTMAEPSKTHAPFGLRRNLDRGTAPRARPRPGRGAVWPSLRCRQRRHTSVWVFVAAARRCAPTSHCAAAPC